MRPALFLVALTLALPLGAQAQMPRPALQHVRWTAGVAPDTLGADGAATLAVEVEIAEGWKMYALDTPPPAPALQLTAEAPGLRVGAFSQPPPAVEDDPNLGVEVHLFRGQARFTAPVTRAGAPPGAVEIPVQIRFTICDKTICLPPTPHTVVARVQVAGAQGAGEKSAAPNPSPAPDAPPAGAPDFTAAAPPVAVPGSTARAAPAPTFAVGSAAGAGGMGGFLLLALVAGLAALLAPCVFPMIPLTVSYFTRHSHSRGEAVRMALLYGASIVGTFTGLGLVLALLVGAAGAQQVAANAYVNLAIGVVFVVFGLSLLGLFEIRVPSRLLNRVGQGERRGGAVGVLFMGLTLTLVSFSCTVPFVGGLLAATVGGAWFWPAVGMLVFSATFALPFVLFALFPRALGALPRSGAWMNTVKVTLGFVELAAAMKFLSQADILLGVGVLSRPLVIALTAVLFVLCGLYLLGKLPLNGEALPALGVGRMMAAVLFLGTALYLLPGLVGAPTGLFDAYLPPRRATDFTVGAGATAAPDPQWLEGEAGLARARTLSAQSGKPIFIDFTAYTCTNCRYMEANVFTHPDVAARLDTGFVRVRLYTDDPDEGAALSRYMLEQTGTVALPTYTLLGAADGEPIGQHSGTASVAAFVRFLDRGLAAPSVVFGNGKQQHGQGAFPEHG